MSSLVRSYHNFRFLVRSVRWVELAIGATIVLMARQLAGLEFSLGPVAAVYGLGILWNVAFWYAGRRHLLLERGPDGARLLVWSWVVADVVTNLLVIYFTGTTASPFLFFLVFPVILSTVALGKPVACYGTALGSVAGLAALWAMQRVGSLPEFAAYGEPTDSTFRQPDVAGGVFVMAGMVLCLLVYTIFRFRPNFFIFSDSVREGRFRIQNFRAGSLQELRLEEVEAVGPEDLLEEAVQGLTLHDTMVFGAAIVLPAGEDTLGGSPGQAWHQGLTRQRVVSTTRRQVIPTWNEFQAERSDLFRRTRHGNTGDLWEGPFGELQRDGLFGAFDGADSYLATVISQHGRAVVVLVAGLRHPVEDRSSVVMHLLNVAAQLKPLLVAESRLSQMRGEMSELANENESLVRVNKLQTDFVSIASHELKTPLTAIGAYTDALLMNANNPDFAERAEFLGVVRSESDRLLRMVNRILDFSRIEFGNRTLERVPVDLGELVGECVKALQAQLDQRDIEVQLDDPGKLPDVEADLDLMQQVLVNLLSNAAKYSPEGGTIHVALREQATVIEVEVRDEGPGIPDDEAENVFKQFYRVRGDDEGAPEGTGLGLAITRNIVELHGGRISVDGNPGQGAAFRFTLPKQQLMNEGRATVLGDVTRRQEFSQVLQLLVRMVADYMECKIVSVMLLSADRKELYIQAAYGLEEHVVRDAAVGVGEGIAGRVAAGGKPLLVEDVREVKGEGNHPQYETASFVSVPMMLEGEVIGVVNCNNKLTGEAFYPDDLSLLITLVDRVTGILSRALRFESTRDELEDTVGALRAMVDLKVEGTGTSRRAVRLAMELGRRLGLSRDQILALQYACLVHDVGMADLGPKLLEKPAPLDEAERELVKAHPRKGADLVSPLLDSREVDEIVRHHHERVDGGGYPNGLRGEQIPLGARILAVVDAYDSITSERPWRARRRPAQAARELVDHAGRQFDAEVVRIFLDVLAESGELARDEYRELKEGQLWLHPVS